MTTLRKDLESLKIQMLREISSLKEDLEKERKARQSLEREVKCQ